jgi:prevent-host-death family protein
MIDLNHIYSLTDFQINAKQYIQQAKETDQPIVLTVNGKAEVIVQDAIAYQKLLDRLHSAESIMAANQEKPLEPGKGKSVRLDLDELMLKYGISR